MSDGVEVDLALGILDHQLIDRDGHNCGKVDDLELTGLDGGRPEVAAILVGGDAWSARGTLGRLAARLSGPGARVAWSDVASVTSVVALARSAEELGLGAGDRRWGALVGRLPGS